MKLNFKTIIIIFLVALLGGAAGTYGIIELNNVKNGNKPTEIVENKQEDKQEITSQITYENKDAGVYSKVIGKAIKSVVEITTEAQIQSQSFFYGTQTSNVTSLGSGVIISDDGYIVTNNHVVASANDVKVKLESGEQYEATIIGMDAKTDLALIKIEANNLPYSNLADSSKLILGQEVIAIGNALGEGTSCSNGIVSAINREVTIERYTMTLIQTNAELNSGNSGGGLFDLNANLVGIVNAKSSTNMYTDTASIEGVGYAIPSNVVKEIIDELVNNGFVKNRPTIGVSILDSQYNEYYGIEGPIIADVVEGGAAQKAGIIKNDIIKAIDGNVVKDYSELAKALEEYKVGDVVKLTIEREGKLIEISLALQESVQQ